MEIAFFLVALAAGVLVGTGLADRLGVPAPLLLVAGGVVVSYLPGMPQVHLEPDLVLLGLLPPLLYCTAIQSSLIDFNAHRRSILLLSVGLVVFTAAGVAVIVHALLPAVPWAYCFAIGAVVAPPDAVAATAIARRIGLPRRIVTVLEGESLLNDATALVSLRAALAAASVGVEVSEVGLEFLLAAGGGVLVGLLVYGVVAWVRRRIREPVTDVGVSFVTPFAAFISAERIHASGVVAVVVAGLLLGHRAAVLQTAQSRIAERINWRTIAFVLENAVFVLIGLQAQWILDGVGATDVSAARVVAMCAATLAGVIVLRMVWVFLARYLLAPPRPDPQTGIVPPWQYTVILGWAGTRGVVTLAAAFVIPDEAAYRDVLVVVAFAVVAGTLFVQGLTLPALARWLRVPAPDPVDDALARATLLQQASKAGFQELDRLEYDDPHGVVDLIRQRVDQRNFAAWERLATTADTEPPSELYARVRLTMIEAERHRVLEIRGSGKVDSSVVADVLAMLDVEESMLDAAQQEREDVEMTVRTRHGVGMVCDDLRDHPKVDEAPATECRRCVEEGTRWVSLRRCLDCGNVACCDSSPSQHATAHFHDTGHRVMQTAEPGEDWRWCYVHHLTS